MVVVGDAILLQNSEQNQLPSVLPAAGPVMPGAGGGVGLKPQNSWNGVQTSCACKTGRLWSQAPARSSVTGPKNVPKGASGSIVVQKASVI